MRALGKKYHPECFKCKECKNLFKSEQFFKYEGEPLCEKCYGTKSHPCEGCKNPILDKIYFIKNLHWHFKCLRCLKCKKEFDKNGFLMISQEPYHKACFDSTCTHCKTPCETEYLLIEGDKALHKECLDEFKKILESADQNK